VKKQKPTFFLCFSQVPKTMQQERIRNLKDFQFQALLGRGGFGSVFLATESSTGLVVAIKRIGMR
jgi:serine/threonine protein kinase